MKRGAAVAILLVLVLAVLAACAQPTPQVIKETVVVTKEVEKVVKETVVVTKEVEKVVTKEVEKVVTKEVVATPTPTGRCAPTDPNEVDEIRIGATGPLSAPGSVVGGVVMQWALNIAVKHINDAGGVLGKPVNLVFYDTEGLPERGTAVAERLITQDCVVGIVGEYHSAVGLAMMEVAHKYHTPVVFAETWNDKITGSQYPEIFRIAPASSMVAEADAKYLADVGAEFVVIVAENTDYGVPASEATKERLAKYGIDSEIFLAEIGTQDFTPLITRIQALDRTPDAVLTLVTGEASYNFEQQAAEAGLMPNEDTICIANQVAINSDEFWRNVPDGNYCLFRRVGLVPALANEVTKKFEADYRRQFDRFPESYALEAYDSLLIMADAINRAGSLDPDAIIAALEDTDLVGAQGRYYFPYGLKNPVPPDQPEWMWHQWPDPAILFLQYWEKGQSWEEACVVWPEKYQTCGTFLVPYGEKPPKMPGQ